jgi:heme A synthase
MTGMSTVNVSLYSDARPASEGFINWSLVAHGFFRAAQILVGVFFVILQVLLVAIPLAVVGGAAAWGVILLVRLIRRRQRPGARAPSRK